ncbi:glycoside hydrolase family 65 protein [Enterococcus sp. LJL99]
MYKRLFEVDPWVLSTHHLDKEHKRLMESLTSIGNGYMGMRGMFEEAYSGDTLQGTYLAGIWFPDKTRVGWWKNGYPDYFGKVINATNFIGMEITIDEVVLDLATIDVTDFLVELDMRNGILTRSFIYKNESTAIRFTFQRFVSIVTQELAVQRLQIEVLSGKASISVRSTLDGQVKNEDSNYEENFWLEQASGFDSACGYLTTQTIPNPFEVPQYTVTTGMHHSYSKSCDIKQEVLPLLIVEESHFTLEEGAEMTIEKQVVVVTSRDILPKKQIEKVQQLITQETLKDFEIHAKEQSLAWNKRWEKSDVKIEGDSAAQQGIRFNLFQLFSTYYGEDERLNIGPKGFTGEKYGGATYWDTEAYIVPMYLSVADPEVTKKLLMYRYNQLAEAFLNAQRQGLSGALYPMVTFTGVECHNEWEITFEEIHRNGAIAYAIYNYTNYTGDDSYLLREGMKVLVAISRFWASRVHYSKNKEQYMIHGVTGPNEYENNVNNNWYTNYIATWVLKYTLEHYPRSDQTIQEELQVSINEQKKWREIIEKMYFPKDDQEGIFVQHDTFLDKELIPVSQLTPENRPINQKWSWDRILRSCFIKQADVLQGIYFFNDQFTKEEKTRNFDFYEPMTVHESSLSPSVHSILAAELGKQEKAVELYNRTARLDLDNYNNDTDDGLHITSMSGSWLAIVQGFAGMRSKNGILSFSPFCPTEWKSYSFSVNYRGRLLHISVGHKEATIRLLSGDPLKVKLFEEELELVVNSAEKLKY